MDEPGPINQLTTREVYRNRWIRVREDTVGFPSGHEGIYGVVTCAPCVGVLPFVDDDHVLLIRQFRYVIQARTWEIPTGANNPGETPREAAQRELAEEVGFRAGRLEHVATVHTSKSVVEETADIYLGYDLVAVDAEADETEEIYSSVVPFTEAVAMVERSEITDSMSVIAILHAARGRGLGLQSGR